MIPMLNPSDKENDMASLEQILADIAKALVDKPDEVEVVVTEEDETSVTLQLSVSAEDMGRVIGRHGRIAKAIRTVMKSAANVQNKKVTVDIK